MGPILALALKDLRLLARDRMGFFFTIVFPLLVAIFFGKVFSGSARIEGIGIAVVDEDGSPSSDGFVRKLEAGEEFAVERLGRAEAADAVRRGRLAAYLVLPPGFGEARGRPFGGEPPRIVLGLDPSRKAEEGMIQGILTRYLVQDLAAAFADREKLREQVAEGRRGLEGAPGVSPEDRATWERFFVELDRFLAEAPEEEGGSPAAFGGSGFEPVRFESEPVARVREGPRSAYDVTFPQGMLWAVLSSSLSFALSLVGERKAGTLFRLRTAPLAPGAILAGKGLACGIAILAVDTLLLAIGVGLFGVRPGSPALLAVAMLAVAIGFVGIMMLFSVMGRTESAVNGLGWGAMMAMAMLGGGMIPLFVMPSWLRAASVASPVRWAILALEGAIWRDFSAGEMALPCGVLVAIGVAGYAIGAQAFRWTEGT